MRYLSLSSLAVLALSTSTFAFFCPTNFTQIDFGYTMDQITQQCGAPASQSSYTKTIDNTPQEWQYFVTQTVGTSQASGTTGTMKTSFVFDSSGKVINITVNGIGVGATAICNGTNIQLNDTRDSVQKACGTPVIINKSNTGAAGPSQVSIIKVTEYIYNTNPPVKLIFNNGKLVDKQ